MGGALSAPVELVHVERRGGPAFRCAAAEMQGWRRSHGNAHAVWSRGPSAAFWVLDGHAGEGAASFCAPELAKEFSDELGHDAGLPADGRIEQGFLAVDEQYRASLGGSSGKAAGATAAGVLCARQGDGTYSLKLACCGDVQGFVLGPPGEEEEAAAVGMAVRKPGGGDEAEGQGGSGQWQWPVVAVSEAHRPSHPSEMARIKAAGGSVSAEEPPRLEGSLAVSRAFGDFEHKSDETLPAAEQKLSCVPDIHTVTGLQPGALCILGSGHLFKALPGAAAAGLVRDRLAQEPRADLGDLAAGLLRAALRMDCQGNMTLMIISLTDGTDWASSPREMQGFEKMREKELAALPEDTSEQYLAFASKKGFPAQPCCCSNCRRWILGMNQCACKEVLYCSKRCQKTAWKDHKLHCVAVQSQSG